jgi:late competence protein required for DNA uptake (superfamily II DNA/RNA helicase)
MIYHEKCGNILRIDLSESTRILADFSIVGKFTAQVTELSFRKSGKTRIPIKYYCVKCKRIVEEKEDVVSKCDRCGEINDVKQSKVPAESGGIFCEKCIERFSGDEKIYSVSIKDIKLPG